jgi:hypothetical protein
VLHPISAAAQPRSVDRFSDRRALAPLDGQYVLFSGEAGFPIAGRQRPYPGGPAYTVGLSPDHSSRNSGAVVHAYDPAGIEPPSPNAIAIDHVTAYQDDIHEHGNHRTPAIQRSIADGPVVGGGIVRRDGNRYIIRETPFPLASFEYQDLLQDIARQPPEQRLAMLDRAYDYFAQRHDQQSIAYDITAATLASALRRLDEAVTNGDDLSAKLAALQLPQYAPPQINH